MPGRSVTVKQALALVCLAGLAAKTFLPLAHAAFWHRPGHSHPALFGGHAGAVAAHCLAATPVKPSRYRLDVECPFCLSTASHRDKLSPASPTAAFISLIETSPPSRLILLPRLEESSALCLCENAPRAPPA